MPLSYTQQTQPSYKNGFARSQSESAYPGLWKGLVGAWVPQLGNTGLTLIDVSPMANNGTLNSMDGTAWEIDGGGHSLNFDGTADYVDGVSPLLTYPSDITLFAYAACNELFPSHDQILSISDPTVSNRYSSVKFHRASGIDRFVYESKVNSGSANSAELLETELPANYAQNKCYSICGRIRNNAMTLYVNGIAGAATGTQGAPTETPTHFQIGRMTNTLITQYANIKVGVALIYNRGLDHSEILALYRDPLAPFRRKIRIPYATPAAAGGGFQPAWAINHSSMLGSGIR